MVVSIKFDILNMLNIFPVETVFLLKKKRDAFLKSVDFLAKKFTNEETNYF
jgi:hypothetical protein